MYLSVLRRDGGRESGRTVWIGSTRGHRGRRGLGLSWSQAPRQVAEGAGSGQVGVGPGDERRRRRNKGPDGAVEWVAKQDTEATLSVRQTQGSH